MNGDPLNVDLAAEIGPWERALTAERKSPKTITTYRNGVQAFLRWAGPGAQLDRATVRKWTASMLDAGAAAATARSHQLGVKRFAAYLADEGVIAADELAGIDPPKLDVPNVPKLDDVELAALLTACEGKSFVDRRDEAIVRLAVETGLRAEEILGMRVADVDQRRGMAMIVRGKGGAGRIVPYGARTGRAIDRYLRLRARHRLAASDALWLGGRNQGLAYDGLRSALLRRAEAAGIEHFHIHRLRHTAASRWLAAGGSEGGLMAVAGWKSRAMLDRYTRDTAMERAADEARRLGLGDV